MKFLWWLVVDAFTVITLTLLICLAALLYSSVGHAGASGYLAAMGLMGIAPSVMKPTALMLNILVATIATIKFYRAGSFSWSVFLPFAVTSIPFAFLGGSFTVPGTVYKVCVGLILLYAAYRLFTSPLPSQAPEVKPIPRKWVIGSGMGIGLLSGLTGTGGGIFLSPLLLFTKWAETRVVAGVSAAFILVNSLAGLAGNLSSVAHVPAVVALWAVAVIVGGWIGSEYGSKRLGHVGLRRLLAIVLTIAALKMMFV